MYALTMFAVSSMPGSRVAWVNFGPIEQLFEKLANKVIAYYGTCGVCCWNKLVRFVTLVRCSGCSLHRILKCH